jgi:mRNA-degrading endonuclease HigB of HigAB toxin-antitoxin module
MTVVGWQCCNRIVIPAQAVIYARLPRALRRRWYVAQGLNAERVRFEVAGGYRMIVAFKFRSAIAFIKFIGTHKEYDKIDALTVSRH